MQTRSNAFSVLELFLVFGLSINPFLLSAAPLECYLQLCLLSYTANQRLREVRHYAQITEPQSRDLKTKILVYPDRSQAALCIL